MYFKIPDRLNCLSDLFTLYKRKWTLPHDSMAAGRCRK